MGSNDRALKRSSLLQENLKLVFEFELYMDNISKEDVLRHLSDLGYSSVDDAKLEEFMTDLKKLIKYEEKRKRVGEKLRLLEQKEAQEASKKKTIRRQGRVDSSNTRSLSENSKVSLRDESKADELSCSHQIANTITDDASSIYVSVDLDPSKTSSRPISAPPLASSLLDDAASIPGGFIRVRSGPN